MTPLVILRRSRRIYYLKMSVENLIVYQKAFDFFVWQKTVVNALAKTHKYSLGVRIEGESLDLLEHLVRANLARNNKDKAIAECLVSIEILKVLFRAGNALNKEGGIGSKHYGVAAEKLVELGNLCGAWFKKFQTCQ